MRIASALLVTSFLMSGAQAADYLRGAIPSELPRPTQQSSYDWSGFYVGGYGSYSMAKLVNSDLNARTFNPGTTSAELNTLISNRVAYTDPSARRGSFGGYFGYNAMFDDVVVGIEGEYSATGLKGRSPTNALVGTANSATANNFYDYNLNGTGQTTINDYMALKARAGWAIDRTLLFASFGIARADIHRQVSLNGTWEGYTLTPQAGGGNLRTSTTGVVPVATTGKYSFAKMGFALGLGAEYALTDNIIVRGEWQYLGFGSASTTASVSKNGYYTLNQLKAGASVKF